MESGDDEGYAVCDGDFAGPACRARPALPCRLSAELKLEVENLEACVRPYAFLTYTCADGMRCVQVLSKRKKVITVKCFDEDDVEDLQRWS